MAPTPGIQPRKKARPGDTSEKETGRPCGPGPKGPLPGIPGPAEVVVKGCGPVKGGAPGGAHGPPPGAVPAAAGTCSAQKTVPKESRRHSSHTGLPQARQYAVAGTSG